MLDYDIYVLNRYVKDGYGLANRRFQSSRIPWLQEIWRQ